MVSVVLPGSLIVTNSVRGVGGAAVGVSAGFTSTVICRKSNVPVSALQFDISKVLTSKPS